MVPLDREWFPNYQLHRLILNAGPICILSLNPSPSTLEQYTNPRNSTSRHMGGKKHKKKAPEELPIWNQHPWVFLSVLISSCILYGILYADRTESSIHRIHAAVQFYSKLFSFQPTHSCNWRFKKWTNSSKALNHGDHKSWNTESAPHTHDLNV